MRNISSAIIIGAILIGLLVSGCANHRPPSAVDAFHIETIFEGQTLYSVNPRHSPDGQTIAFTAHHGGLTDIAIVPVSGGEAILLTSNGHSLQPVWSPDGSRIAFTIWDTDTAEIFDIAANGSFPDI